MFTYLKQRLRPSIQCFILQMSSTVKAGLNQMELHSSFPCGWLEPKYLSFLMLPRCTSSKLNHKEGGWDSEWHSDTEHQHSHKRINPLHHNANSFDYFVPNFAFFEKEPPKLRIQNHKTQIHPNTKHNFRAFLPCACLVAASSIPEIY